MILYLTAEEKEILREIINERLSEAESNHEACTMGEFELLQSLYKKIEYG